MGALYRPARTVSLGLSVSNIGPDITYYPKLPGEAQMYWAALPLMARVGLCWSPVENRYLGLSVMPELDKMLVGAFSDTMGKSLGRQLAKEWNDVRKSLGVEAIAFNIVSFRLGYLEDLTNRRGGVVLEKESKKYQYGIWDALTHKRLGKVERVGLCWGFGIGYKDYFRFDVSSDAAIYDFPTKNWKFSLVANDIAAGIRELKQGHEPWED